MMARLIQGGILFQHIPRTGGTWTEAAIARGNIPSSSWLMKQAKHLPKKHALLSHYNRNQLHQIRRVFTFVRHPIAYYESTWKWMRIHGTNVNRFDRTWHPFLSAAVQYRESGGGFDDWVFLMLSREPLWFTRLIEQYVGPKGGEFCNFIGRTESLNADFIKAMEHFKIPLDDEKKTAIRALQQENDIRYEVQWSGDLMSKMLESEQSVVDRFYGEETLNRRVYCDGRV